MASDLVVKIDDDDDADDDNEEFDEGSDIGFIGLRLTQYMDTGATNNLDDHRTHRHLDDDDGDDDEDHYENHPTHRNADTHHPALVGSGPSVDDNDVVVGRSNCDAHADDHVGCGGSDWWWCAHRAPGTARAWSPRRARARTPSP